MKKIGLSVLMAFLVLNVFAQGINFSETTLDEAFKIAKKENKLIFVDCYTTWCSPCKRLSLSVFPDKSVGDVFNKDFISIKKDMETEEGKEIAKKYDVHSYPTLLWLDGEGKIQHRVIGLLSVEELLSAAELALDGDNNWVGLSRRYEAGERDLDFMQKYIIAANEFGKTHKEAIDTYLLRKSPQDMVNVHDFKIIRRNVKSISHPLFKYVLQNQDKFQEVIDELQVEKFLGQIVIYEFWDFKNKGDQAGLKAKMEELKSMDEAYATRMIDYYDVTLHEGKPSHPIAYFDYKLKYFANDRRSLSLGVYSVIDRPGKKGSFTPEVIEKLREVCDHILEIDQSWGSYDLYVLYLDATGQEDEARQMAHKTLKMVPEDKVKTSSSWWLLYGNEEE